MTKIGRPGSGFLDSVDTALGQGAKKDGSGTHPSLGAEGRFGLDKPLRRIGNDGPSLSQRWDGPPVRLRRRKACLSPPKPMLRVRPLLGGGGSSMELFRAEKIATVHDQSNHDCRFCGGRLTLLKTIAESESGVVIHIFECLVCEDRTWTA
jgi:hypothetical protein